jgi:hypothetical protein
MISVCFYSVSLPLSISTYGGWLMGIGVKNFLPPLPDEKVGILNFSGGLVIGVKPILSIEFGFDYHVKYLNKTIIGGYPADTTKTALGLFIGGVRLNLIKEGSFRPFANSGFGSYIMRTKDNKSDDGIDVPDSSTNKPGLYFGGGINYFINDKLALHIPVKLHIVLIKDINPLFLTFGAGIEYYFK